MIVCHAIDGAWPMHSEDIRISLGIIFPMSFESSLHPVSSSTVLLHIRFSSLHDDMLSNRFCSGVTASAAAAAGSGSLLRFFFNNGYRQWFIVFECLARSRNRCRQTFAMSSMISPKNAIHFGSRCRVMTTLLASSMRLLRATAV